MENAGLTLFCSADTEMRVEGLGDSEEVKCLDQLQGFISTARHSL